MMKRRDCCGLCKGTDLVQILDLGEMPLANAFLKKEDFKHEKKYPLRVYFCRDCKSVQLLDIVNPDIVFRQYEYLTSASKPLSDHFVEMGNTLFNEFIESGDDLIVEIGGNDGVLLEPLRHKCRILNVDPAQEAAKLARQRGVPTYCVFFNTDVLRGRKAKLIIANNVMAHIDDLPETFAAVRDSLTADGVFVFEVHWLGNLIGEGGFDQIYHEHIYYHSLLALENLVNRSKMAIFRVQTVPIHGQSLRVFVSKERTPEWTVGEFLKREVRLGLDKEETFHSFQQKIFRNKRNLVELCRMLKRERCKVVGYGAPAKGNTLLNYFNIKLDYIIDTTPLKQGLYTPGMHIEVSPPERLKKEPPDYLLVLAWNYAAQILEKEQAIRDYVKFLIPVPELKIL